MLTRLEFPESAFRLDSTVLKCGDILKKSSLDLEGIAREIVGKNDLYIDVLNNGFVKVLTVIPTQLNVS